MSKVAHINVFIAGFVSIWHSQLQLDFDNAPRWDAVAPDLGPHLSRLPDELLPAIEKFLIIARDGCENVSKHCITLEWNGRHKPKKHILSVNVDVIPEWPFVLSVRRTGNNRSNSLHPF